ncbi:hypothetical protein BJ742DRAFT_845682 [Cladochytrium replicatum]|nr:hypothetical protein BJ742DRAFT_845682 [Cladochytrium replicatum]
MSERFDRKGLGLPPKLERESSIPQSDSTLRYDSEETFEYPSTVKLEYGSRNSLRTVSLDRAYGRPLERGDSRSGNHYGLHPIGIGENKQTEETGGNILEQWNADTASLDRYQSRYAYKAYQTHEDEEDDAPVMWGSGGGSSIYSSCSEDRGPDMRLQYYQRRASAVEILEEKIASARSSVVQSATRAGEEIGPVQSVGSGVEAVEERVVSARSSYATRAISNTTEGNDYTPRSGAVFDAFEEQLNALREEIFESKLDQHVVSQSNQLDEESSKKQNLDVNKSENEQYDTRELQPKHDKRLEHQKHYSRTSDHQLHAKKVRFRTSEKTSEPMSSVILNNLDSHFDRTLVLAE